MYYSLVSYLFGYIIFPFLGNLINLDLSYQADLEFWDPSGMERFLPDIFISKSFYMGNLHLINELIW